MQIATIISGLLGLIRNVANQFIFKLSKEEEIKKNNKKRELYVKSEAFIPKYINAFIARLVSQSQIQASLRIIGFSKQFPIDKKKKFSWLQSGYFEKTIQFRWKIFRDLR